MYAVNPVFMRVCGIFFGLFFVRFPAQATYNGITSRKCLKNERGSKEMTDRMSRIKVKAILLVVMLVLTIATGVTAMASAKSGSMEYRNSSFA